MLIKPASSGCNLHCRYCFYNDIAENRNVRNFGIMKQETVDLLYQRIKEITDLQELNISFQGGEPTVAGLKFFEYFTRRLKDLNVPINYSIQTNGTLINEKWAQLFHDFGFLVGVSIDGFRENMDQFRFDYHDVSVFNRTISTLKLLDKYQVEYNVLTVVTSQLAQNPKRLLDFYLNNKIRYVQLIPCLPPLNEPHNGFSLTPENYSAFYLEFFRLWKTQVEKGVFLSVNLFENLAAMLQGQYPYQCGMLGHCPVHFVLESNGDVYPCDFYCTDEYLLGNISDHSIEEIFTCQKAVEFTSSGDCMKQPCEDCRFRSICNGACRRQNVCFLTDEDCAYKKVLEVILPELARMIQR